MSIYFDNAATSDPKPPEVVEAVRRALTEHNANPGRSGHRAALEAAQIVLNAREGLRALMDAQSATQITFGLNCTDALNLAIKGSLCRGDHVISTMLEHNSVLRPLSALAAQGRIELTLLSPRPDGFVDPDDVRAALRPHTALIAVTHASNVTGAIQPVAAIGQIARQAGVRYLIDGAQALGALPVSVRALKCDLYAFPGHKSLLGPQGTGGLYIRPGLALRTLREGGTGTGSDSMLQPKELPERYKSGTVNLPGIAGLGAGCAYVSQRLSTILSHRAGADVSAVRGTDAHARRDCVQPAGGGRAGGHRVVQSGRSVLLSGRGRFRPGGDSPCAAGCTAPRGPIAFSARCAAARCAPASTTPTPSRKSNNSFEQRVKFQLRLTKALTAP